MATVEEILTKTIVWKQESGQPTTVSEGIQIDNNLVKEMKTEHLVQELHISCYGKISEISKKYWHGFMKISNNVLANVK